MTERPASQQIAIGRAVLSSTTQVRESTARSIDAAWRRILLTLFSAPPNEFPVCVKLFPVPGRRELVANPLDQTGNLGPGAAR